MASFTRISDDERPSISVDANAVISKIEDNIYGGFTEWVFGHSTYLVSLKTDLRVNS